MIYHFQALDRKGKTVSDYIDAQSEMQARQKIRGQGLYLVRLGKQSMDEAVDEQKRSPLYQTVISKISDFINIQRSSKHVGIFSRQLSTLLNAGVPLATAISDIIEQLENKHFKKVVGDIKEKIEEGTSFSTALIRHRSIFSDMYINMVRVGENLGSLEHVMERLAEVEEKRNILKTKIKAALWYPSFMLVFAAGVVTFLMISVIPSIAAVFEEQNQILPLPTKIVLAVSGFLSNFWFIIPVFILASIYLYQRYVQTTDGRRKVDEIKLKIPLIKNIYKKIIVLRFTQNLGILLGNRVDLLKSFEIIQKIVGNTVIEDKIIEAAQRIREGSSVGNALNKSEFLPKLVIGMIVAGEASDKLDDMLLNIGRVYENELDMTITNITSLIEPVIIIIMGIAIGIIVLSVMLPIMNMSMLLR